MALGVRESRFQVVLLVLALMTLRAPGLDPTLSDQSTWRQTETATLARNFIDDPRILWPRVNWGAPGPGFVEAEFQLLPYVTTCLYRLFGENPVFGRLLTLLAAALACLVVYRIARHYFSHRHSLLCVAVFAIEPVLFRYSYVFMPDAVALLFFLVALERFMVFLDDSRWMSLLQSASAMALAILVKPTSIHLGLVLCILAVSRLGWRSLFSTQLVAFAVISLAPASLYYVHAASLYATYGNTFGLLSGGDSKWGSLAWRLNPRFYWNLAFMDTAWTVGPVGSVLALIGIFRVRVTGWRLLTVSWAVTTLTYYLIVARYAGSQGLGLHYHIYVAPLVALLTTGGFVVISNLVSAKPWMIAILASSVFAYQAVCDSLILATKKGGNFLRAGQAVARVSDPDDLILVLSDNPSIVDGEPNNYQRPDVFFHSRRRGRALALDHQSAPGFEETLGSGVKWFVNFPSLNDMANHSYFEFIARHMSLVVDDPDFQVFRITKGEQD